MIQALAEFVPKAKQAADVLKEKSEKRLLHILKEQKEIQSKLKNSARHA